MSDVDGMAPESRSAGTEQRILGAARTYGFACGMATQRWHDWQQALQAQRAAFAALESLTVAAALDSETGENA